MEMKDFVRVLKAVENLSPGTTFTMSNDDFDTIEWKSNGAEVPTKDKLFLEIERLKQEEILIEAEAQAKRQALLDKLGITEDEARLLLGGN